jgi:hypothetical protein
MSRFKASKDILKHEREIEDYKLSYEKWNDRRDS